MKKIITNYDNIMNPNEALKDYMNSLKALYIEDYGEKYSKLIKERIKKTIYIFDSLPVDEVNFFEEHKNRLGYSKEADLAFLECRDFFNKKTMIDEKINQKYYTILANVFGVYGRFIDELFSLDIEAYSLDNQIALGDECISVEVKEDIIKRQEEYKRECARLNIKCLTNAKTIEWLLELRDDFAFETNYHLVKNTKWAKRIKRRIFEEKRLLISDIDLTELLFYCTSGSSNLIDTDRKEKLRICHFPLLANVCRGNLDGMFFHENRHVIEMSDEYAGFQCFENGRYCSMNEIRTEKNAIRDKEKMSNKPLFSNNDFYDGVFNVYEKLFQYTEGFFDEHLEVLNRIAVGNNFKDFERLFGRKNLREFDFYLNNIQEAICNDMDSEYLCDKDRQKQLVKCLNERYESRH